ncbi:MAG: hypothetical protein QXL86_01550 [Candidatus Aenigmatarchaeota archaeon]
MKKSTNEEVIKKIYCTIKKLKEGSINTIANKSGVSWHAANKALKIMEILGIVKEDKEKTHAQQKYYRLIR